jgi:hypothetical protein
MTTRITAGPDGNLWFIAGEDRIGKITRTGVITEFSPIKFNGHDYPDETGPKISGITDVY